MIRWDVSAVTAHWRQSIAIAVLAVTIAGCKPAETVATAPPQPIQVMVVAGSASADTWSFVGTVRARHESDLGFRVAGKISARLVDIGQKVEPGQVVLRLEPTDYQLAVEAQLADVRASHSSRDQAIAAEQRFKVLFAQGHVAKAALEQRQAVADEARGRSERAERSLALARNQLAYTELKADHAGVVSALPAEVGQVVTAGQPVLRLARLDLLEAQVALPENLLDAARSATAELDVWGSHGQRLPATLRELSPDADRISRTYQARFSFASDGQVPELGRTVTVHLRRPASNEAFKLPLAAVMQDGGSPAVWTVDATGTRVRRLDVVMQRLTADSAFVTGALQPGDRVVTMGVHMLDAEKPIRIVEQRAALK